MTHFIDRDLIEAAARRKRAEAERALKAMRQQQLAEWLFLAAAVVVIGGVIALLLFC